MISREDNFGIYEICDHIMHGFISKSFNISMDNKMPVFPKLTMGSGAGEKSKGKKVQAVGGVAGREEDIDQVLDMGIFS